MPINKIKHIKPSACQATHYNGTRNKSITSSLARRGLKTKGALCLTPLLSIIGISSSTIVTTNTYADNRNLLFTVNASTPSLEISVPSSVMLDVVPSSSGTFGYADINVLAGSSSGDGYKLMMYTTSITNPTDLVGTKGSVIQTLDTKSGGYTQEDFTINRWGYKWNFNGSTTTNTELHNPKTNYFPIVNNAGGGNPLTVTSKNSNAEATTVTLATKLDNETPADSYSTMLSFVILANNSTDTSTFDAAFYANGKTTYTYQDATGATVNTGLYTMQDMTSTICSTVPTPKTTTSAPEARLIDTRDKKMYWVAKLKDGKCWMTQGLDLDLSSSVALTPTDSDVTANWTPINSTEDSTTKTITVQTTSNNASSSGFTTNWNTDGNDKPHSTDPGDRYVVPTQATTTYANYWDLQDTYYNSLTACNTALASTSSFTGTDCTHYQLGNFYNFAAATATNSVETTLGGSSNVVNYADMPNSICPANWRLPHGLLAASTNGTASVNNSEFDTLLYAYNVTNLVGATANQELSWSNSLQANGYTGLNNIRKSPLYFIRPGNVDGGMLYNAGVFGISWSGTIGAMSYGYYLSFGSTAVRPAFNNARYFGFPVRCIAR